MILEDKERLEKFMKLLPEQTVEHFLNLLLSSGKISDKYLAMCSDYDIYSNEILSQFTNPKINETWKTFNTSFEALQDFIDEHHISPDRFYIKHSPKWNAHIAELKKLAKDFEEKYSGFIFLAKKELAVANKTPDHEKENILVKNKKRVTLPKFRREEWSKISIKFLDDRNFLLSDPRDTKPCSPESIGCLDERDQRPDDAWEFLMRVAKGNGTTDPIDKKEREKQKKHKQKITDILRTIFENDTDPFEKEKGGVYKAKFSIGYIEDDRPKIKEKREFLDLEDVWKEMTDE